MSLLEKLGFRSHLPERQPQAGDYAGVDRIEVVDLSVNGRGGNTREQLIRARLLQLKAAGIPVEEVDIETENDIKGRTIVVSGSVEDVCVAKRRGFLRRRGAKTAVIDTSLTSDF